MFNTCGQFLRPIPNLVYDNKCVEDIDTAMEDHDYDAMRYFFMMNPIAAAEEKSVSRTPPWNPLE